jgi:hypothetical protein
MDAGILLGLDPVPAYLAMLQDTGLEGLNQGVNFASGAAGILDESGYNYVLQTSHLTSRTSD